MLSASSFGSWRLFVDSKSKVDRQGCSGGIVGICSWRTAAVGRDLTRVVAPLKQCLLSDNVYFLHDNELHVSL